MPPQARIGDYSLGHWIGVFYFPPTPLIEGSPDTYSCCIPACRVGDKAAPHFAFIFGVVPFPYYIHTGQMRAAATGSPDAFINSKPAFRVGDSYICGDTQAQGCVLDEVQ